MRLPRPLYRRWYASGIPAFLSRAGISWRFLRGRSVAEDYFPLVSAGEDASGFYAIRSTDLDSMVEALEDRFGDLTEAQKDRARNALKRTIEKWDWYDDGRSDLEDAAIERFIEWSRQDGDVLHDSWEEEAA